MARTLIASGIGLIITILFFLDGWKPPPTGVSALRSIPRIAGFSAIVGGSVLSGFTSYVIKDPNFILNYLVAVVLTFLILLIFMILYGVIFSYNRIYQLYPWKTKKWLIVETWPYIMRLIKYGWEDYHDTIDKVCLEVRSVQRDKLIEFSRGFYDGIISVSDQAKETPVISFENLATRYMEVFISLFFDGRPMQDDFRICLYWYDEDTRSFRYLNGHAPHKKPYSRKDLPINSLAGKSIMAPTNIIKYSADDNRHGSGFHVRDHESPYKWIYVKSVSGLSPGQNAPLFVLCIDCKDPVPPVMQEYLDDAIITFTIALSHLASLLQLNKTLFYDFYRNHKQLQTT